MLPPKMGLGHEESSAGGLKGPFFSSFFFSFSFVSDSARAAWRAGRSAARWAGCRRIVPARLLRCVWASIWEPASMVAMAAVLEMQMLSRSWGGWARTRQVRSRNLRNLAGY